MDGSTRDVVTSEVAHVAIRIYCSIIGDAPEWRETLRVELALFLEAVEASVLATVGFHAVSKVFGLAFRWVVVAAAMMRGVRAV